MKTLLVLSLAFLFMAAKPVQNITADSIMGDWYSEKKESVIRIEKRNGKYYGRLVWISKPNNEDGQPKLDKNNPDEKLRSQPLQGLTIIHNLEYNDDNEWEDGDIYDPRSGKTYSCEASLEDINTLKLRGYMGFSLLGKTTVWTRKQ